MFTNPFVNFAIGVSLLVVFGVALWRMDQREQLGKLAVARVIDGRVSSNSAGQNKSATYRLNVAYADGDSEVIAEVEVERGLYEAATAGRLTVSYEARGGGQIEIGDGGGTPYYAKIQDARTRAQGAATDHELTLAFGHDGKQLSLPFPVSEHLYDAASAGTVDVEYLPGNPNSARAVAGDGTRIERGLWVLLGLAWIAFGHGAYRLKRPRPAG